MSVIDDSRVLLQDIVAPDLKAITTRLEAFEANTKQRFDAVEANMKQRFDAVEKLAEARHDLLILRMDTASAATDAKFAALLAAIEARFAAADAKSDAIIRGQNIDRRLEQLEAARTKDTSSEERHA